MKLKGNILAGKILVKAFEKEEVTKTGIIIPPAAKERPDHGKVVLVGDPKDNELMEVSVGDIVHHNKFAGQEIDIEGEKYLLMSQDDILFIYG